MSNNNEHAETIAEVEAMTKPNTPAALIEMIAVQLVTARRARQKIDAEGLIVGDVKGNPVVHPAIALEAAAQKRAAAMLRPVMARQPKPAA